MSNEAPEFQYLEQNESMPSSPLVPLSPSDSENSSRESSLVPLSPTPANSAQMQLLAGDEERILVVRGLELNRPIKEINNMFSSDFDESQLTVEEILRHRRLAWTVYIKWHFKEIPLRYEQLDNLRMYLYQIVSEQQRSLLTLSKIPDAPKSVRKWEWVRSLFQAEGLPYADLPQVRAGNFDFINDTVPIGVPSCEVSYNAFEKPLNFTPSKKYFGQFVDNLLILPKLEKLNILRQKDGALIYCGSLNFFIKTNLKLFLGFINRHDNGNIKSLDFLSTSLPLEMRDYFKAIFVKIFNNLRANKKVFLNVIIAHYGGSSHAVCLQINRLRNPLKIAGYEHYYQFTWLDNNDNLSGSETSVQEYRSYAGSTARRRITFLISYALTFMRNYLKQHGAEDGQASNYLNREGWFEAAFQTTREKRHQWVQCVATHIYEDFAIAVNTSYKNTERSRYRAGFCIWWTYAFIVDMLQNNMDMRTYYKDRLVPYNKFRKTQQSIKLHEQKFILGFYVYCCCYEWWHDSQLLACQQTMFTRYDGWPQFVNDDLQVKSWSDYKDYKVAQAPDKREIFVEELETGNKRGKRKFSDVSEEYLSGDDSSETDDARAYSLLFDSDDDDSEELSKSNKRPKNKDTSSSTASIFFNHTRRAMVSPRTPKNFKGAGKQRKKGVGKSKLYKHNKLVPAKQTQKAKQEIRTARPKQMSRIDMLSRLPTVLRTPGTDEYYVTTDAIASFTAAYFEDYFPSEAQFEFIKAQITPLLAKTEELGVAWDGEPSDISVPELIAALIETVGTNGNRKKDLKWTGAAAGMVLLMWAETTQTPTVYPV